MRIEVLPARELGPDVANAWDHASRANPSLASPYFTPEYTRLVGETRKDAFVAVIEEQNRIVAVFPFQRLVGGVGIPIGGPVSDYQAVIAAPEIRVPARQLMRGAGLYAYVFDHLLAEQSYFESFQDRKDRSLVINLSDGFDAYQSEKDRSSEQLSVVRRKSRKLAREIGPLRYETYVSDSSVLSQVLAWKTEQSGRTGTERLFERAWARTLLERIHATRSPSFSGVLSALWAGDVLVAAHMGMRSRSVWHYWFPTYNADFAKYAPGLCLLLEMARAAPAMGIETIDLGKGEQRYKSAFANAEVSLAEGVASLVPYTKEAIAFARASRERIRRSPFYGAARIPAHAARSLHRWAIYR